MTQVSHKKNRREGHKNPDLDQHQGVDQAEIGLKEEAQGEPRGVHHLVATDLLPAEDVTILEAVLLLDIVEADDCSF